MEFASSVLSTLLPKLTQLLQDEYNLQKGLRKNIEFLSTELKCIHIALKGVSEVPFEELDEQRRLWANRIRDLSYDMEDVLDKFILRVKGPDPLGKKFLKKMKKKVTGMVARHGIAKEIEDIKESLRMMDEQTKRYIVDAPTHARTTYDPRITALYTNVSELVGIREAMEEVKSLLKLKEGNDEQHKRRIVVSIAGFGGLGKTTLAKAVYDETKAQFDYTAFVSVSRNPDIQKLLKDMLYGLDNEKGGNIPYANFDETKLIEHIREILKNKRYLVVIDDIWANEPWEIIRCALFENNMGSRIITTTRRVDVAKHIGGYYSLKQLSDENSERLFYGRVFGSIDESPGNFSEISKKILQKCGGVPLAIITMASLLANKSNNMLVWKDVYKSIGLGLVGSNHDMNNMNKILLLSYYDLPFHLKTCLLYLSMFPEDYEITKDELIWRWIAEGFIQKQQREQGFLEIGKSYFNELLNRSLILPTRIDDEGTPEACRVHDTVLDLLIYLSKEECFVGTVSGDEKHSVDSKVRRISLLGSTTRPAMMEGMPKLPKLRTLTIFNPGVVLLSMPSLSCYHHLRVLDLRSCILENLASLRFVGNLSYLRYLGISCGDLESTDDRLPVEIGKLRFLQVLDLSKTMVGELPPTIIGLGQLVFLRGGGGARHLRIGPTTLPGGLKNGNLTSLEVLERATVRSKRFAQELGYLTQLKVLSVGIPKDLLEGRPSNKDDREHGSRACMKAVVASVGKLKRLESLQITTEGSYNFVCLDGSMDEPLDNLQRICIRDATVLPSWIKAASLPVLSYLNICVKTERREDFQVLGMLPCLRRLRFVVMDNPVDARERCVVGPDAFPSLEICHVVFIDFLSKEKGSIVPSMFPQGAMPRLQHLRTQINLEHFSTSTPRGVALFNVDNDLAWP